MIPSEKYIISVGAGINQLPFLKKAKEKGFKIVGFDQNENAPGKRFCSIFKPLSTWNYKEAISWLESLNLPFSAVGCLSCSKAVVTQQYIANRLNLPAVMDVELVSSVQNKREMKKILDQLDFNDVRNSYHDQDTLMQQLKKIKAQELFVVKSINGLASNDIHLYDSTRLYRKLKFNELSLEEYVVEPYVIGREYRAITIVQNKEIQLFDLIQKENLNRTFFTARMQPAFDQFVIEKVKENVKQIIQKLNLTNSLLKIDMILQHEQILILEIDFEIPGDYYENNLSKHFYSYDYLLSYIDFIFGNQVTRIESDARKYRCADYLYNISEDEKIFVDYKKIRNVLDSLLGDYLLISTQEEKWIDFPKSNNCNFGLVIHNDIQISNDVLNHLLTNELKNDLEEGVGIADIK